MSCRQISDRVLVCWYLVDSNLEIICTAPHHSLTIYRVSAWLHENSRRIYPKTKWFMTYWQMEWQLDRRSYRHGGSYRASSHFIKQGPNNNHWKKWQHIHKIKNSWWVECSGPNQPVSVYQTLPATLKICFQNCPDKLNHLKDKKI